MFGLVPREEKYFAMLSQLAEKVREGGEIFIRIFQDFSNRAVYADQIKQIETTCDDLGAKITQKLNSSFITPIDREDIYLLVKELDDVIDLMNDLARRFDIYEISVPRSEAMEIAQIVGRSTVELEGAFTMLQQRHDVGEHCRTIRQLEKRADSLYSDALRRLFREEKDPMEVIKWMSIFEELENTADRCKDVAEALEAVVVKNK